MLVLEINTDDRRIQIVTPSDEVIWVSVQQVRTYQRVLLGFEADKGVKIYRERLVKRQQEQEPRRDSAND